MYLSEADWRDTPFPADLLRHAGDRPRRKLRLFACHCCRRLGGLLTRDSVHEALATAERFADREASAEQLKAGWMEVRRALSQAPLTTRWEWALTAALHTCAENVSLAYAMIVGRYAAMALGCDWVDPASMGRPAEAQLALARPAESRHQCTVLRDLFPYSGRPVCPHWLRWQGGEALRVAEAIYREGRWDDMPVLADALEEAGCDDFIILDHARWGGPHFKGCWLVDALLIEGGVLAQV
jgi:hypothetical protein